MMIFLSHILTLAVITAVILLGLKRLGGNKFMDALILFAMGVAAFFLIRIGIYGLYSEVPLRIFLFDFSVGQGDFGRIYQNALTNIENSGMRIFLTAAIPAFIEEIAKLGCLMYFHRKTRKIQSIKDAVYMITFVALGFSFVESWSYIWVAASQGGNQSIFVLTVVRSFVLSIGHIFFSLLTGYAYGRALFEKFHVIDSKTTHTFAHSIRNMRISLGVLLTISIGGIIGGISTNILSLTLASAALAISVLVIVLYLDNVKRSLKLAAYYMFKYVLLGILGAIAFHSVFNAGIELGWKTYLIPIIYIGVYIVYILIDKAKHVKINYQTIKGKIRALKMIRKIKQKHF